MTGTTTEYTTDQDKRAIGLRSKKLRALWEERDERYRRPKPVTWTPDLVDGVRRWRWHEAAELGNVSMMQAAERWTPPWGMPWQSS